jgi:hypothetical protein
MGELSLKGEKLLEMSQGFKTSYLRLMSSFSVFDFRGGEFLVPKQT